MTFTLVEPSIKTTEKKVQTKTSIFIDGPVGAGKSTLMNMFEDAGFTAFPEPVVDNPLLDRYYPDKKRWGFDTQVFFGIKRVNHIKSTFGFEKVALDRSVHCDRIFAEALRDAGYLEGFQFDMYTELMANMLESTPPPSLMIYLQISVEEAINRINIRGRDYEIKEKREYWEDLNARYEKFFKEYNSSPLLVINVTELDFEHNPKDRAHVLNLINQKLIELGHETLKEI